MPISSLPNANSLLAINHNTFDAAPLPNSREQQYLLDSAMNQCRLKEDHFYRCASDDERVIWMARIAEPLGDGRIGGECYLRLYERIVALLLSASEMIDTDSVDAYIVKLAMFTPLVPRLFVQLCLAKKSPNSSLHFSTLHDQLDGVLNPLKALYLRKFIIDHLPDMFTETRDSLRNAKHCSMLWSRWTRYGGCGEVEVREWERDQLFPIVEQSVCLFLRKCRNENDDYKGFEEWCIEGFLKDHLADPNRITDDQTQSRIFKVITEHVPKAIISKHFDSLLLVVMRFSPAVNVTFILQELIELAFREGSVKMMSVWERVKETIEMRPELDLNDSLRLVNTVIMFALKEDDLKVIPMACEFIIVNLLDGIDQLSANEPSSYSLLNIIDLIIGSGNTCLESVMPFCGKLERVMLRGLAEKLLRCLRNTGNFNWPIVLEFVEKCTIEVEEEGIVNELIGFHDLSNVLEHLNSGLKFKVINQLLNGTNVIKVDPLLIKKAIELPVEENFLFYIQLLSLLPCKYELFASVSFYCNLMLTM